MNCTLNQAEKVIISTATILISDISQTMVYREFHRLIGAADKGCRIHIQGGHIGVHPADACSG